MQRISGQIFSAFTAMVLTFAIFYSTMILALKIVESSVYRQSKVVSMLVQQESIGITGLLEDTHGIEMLLKFAGALTSAYINFELIPLNESRVSWSFRERYR